MFQGWICLIVLGLERKAELWFELYLLRCYFLAMVSPMKNVKNGSSFYTHVAPSGALGDLGCWYSIHIPPRWGFKKTAALAIHIALRPDKIGIQIALNPRCFIGGN